MSFATSARLLIARSAIARPMVQPLAAVVSQPAVFGARSLQTTPARFDESLEQAAKFIGAGMYWLAVRSAAPKTLKYVHIETCVAGDY